MPQAIIFTDEEEDNKVKLFSKKWEISKAETIKRIIKLFEEKEDGHIK